MLALDLRRHNQDIHLIDHPSPALQPPHLAFFDRLPYTLASASPSPSAFNNRKAHTGYFDSSVPVIESSASQPSLADQYMTDAYNYPNPAIRVQQSTPTPSLELPQSFTDNSSYSYNGQWDNYSGNEQMAARRNLQAAAISRNRSHQRAQSSSSLGSSSSASPYSNGHAPYPYSNDSSSGSKLGQNFTNIEHTSNGFSNHLPTPTQTPTQESFMTSNFTPAYSQGGDMNSTMAAHLAMNTAFDSHSIAEDEAPGISHSSRQSVSSLQDPSTPRTLPDAYDGDFKMPTNVTDQSMRFPKLDRTVSDAYQDELYDPTAVNIVPPTSASKSKHYLTPHAPRNMINDYLQAAHMARSQSPTSSTSRGVSPFRPDSPYVQGAFGQMQKPYNTASQVRQAQQARASQKELSQHVAQLNEEPKTISPKDAMLEYNPTEEDTKMPLFSETEASSFGQQFNGGQQNFNSGAVQNTSSLNQAQASDWSSNPRRRSNNAPIMNSNSASGFNFATPAVSTNFQGLPFSSQNYRSTALSGMKQEDATPDFPAHLTSMESSASEAPPSSQNSNHYVESRKPVSSAADSGTYTCTYHGCSLRFDTPQRLQKHKRDGHRISAPSVSAPAVSVGSVSPAPGVGSGMTSAALAQRNSQAGPHKCERINPTTGKPCNTIFSRPYDLTRHEDTIHNARKQKVRCALCVEEKTFSRNDALTRHMRVVHPEVDFPGKHRRRGGSD